MDKLIKELTKKMIVYIAATTSKFISLHAYTGSCVVSRASLSYPKEGERVWSNAYRARVPAHCIVRANQMHGIKSHDCAGMKGMQINDYARARSYPSTKWNVNIFAFLIHAHQKYVTSCIPR